MRYLIKHNLYNVKHPDTGAVRTVAVSAGQYINPKRQEKKYERKQSKA